MENKSDVNKTRVDELYQAYLDSMNKNNTGLNKVVQTQDERRLMIDAYAKRIEEQFKEIAYDSLSILTSALTHEFTSADKDILVEQLKKLVKREGLLDALATDFNSGYGKEHLSMHYKNAYVAGQLAKNRLIGILGEVE